jgi:hypothetical protein
MPGSVVATSSVRPDLGSMTRARVLQARRRSVQHPVVIVARAILQLRMRASNPRADRG